MCEDQHDHHHANHRPHSEHVVLEIGGELGALIVYTGPALLHGEIEISPAGEDDRRSHKEVLERRAGNRPAYTAVFDGLAAGRYTLWVDGAPRSRDVEIRGGRIAELCWQTVSPAVAA